MEAKFWSMRTTAMYKSAAILTSFIASRSYFLIFNSYIVNIISTNSAIEFLDIKCGHTTCSLMLTGSGETPHFEFKPDFVVCRLQVVGGTTTEATFEIRNICLAEVTLTFEKILELEGRMKDEASPEREVADDKKETKRKKGAKGGEKRSKSSKSNKKKGKKGKMTVEKFGTDLSSDEIYSLKNFYENRRGPSYFKIVEDEMQIPPSGKKNVVLRFGLPEEPRPRDVVDAKKDKKGKKGSKSSKSSKSSDGNAKGGKKGKGKGKNKVKDDKYYVAKYNVLLGGRTFVKDLVVIGNFLSK